MKSFAGRKSKGNNHRNHKAYGYYTLKYKRKFVVIQANHAGKFDPCERGYITEQHFADPKREPNIKYSKNQGQFYNWGYSAKDPWEVYDATDEEKAWLEKSREVGKLVEEPKGDAYEIY
jgi:hypothetical protein